MAAANTVPIVSRVGHIGSTFGVGPVITANTNYDGSGTVYLVFTADATYGSFVQRIRFRPMGTTGATVMRVWINDGAAPTTSTMMLWDEITCAATTTNNAAALALYELPLNFALPPGYRIYVSTGSTANHCVTVIGGKY